MREKFDIQEYMTRGVERVVKDALLATVKNPAQAAFFARFAKATKAASKKRNIARDNGEHIPPFLISSITSNCNLHCKGCYSRENGATSDCSPDNQLTAKEWSKIFMEADDLGISFILLAGGEPLIRKDVIIEATKYQNILFPIFTNGVFMSDEYFDLFTKNRNLIPIMSIEGDEEATDNRRGPGIYKRLTQNMDKLKEKGIIWGASVTVTSENVAEVTSEAFLKGLYDNGCKAVIYVEFVPVTEDSMDLALTDEQQAGLQDEVAKLRKNMQNMVFISFPGDEKSSDGCVAAGRGFFHINSHGGAEPCPFSPFSDINVRDTSVREAIASPLFRALQVEELLKDDHVGGCTLFMKKDRVMELANSLS